MNKSSWTVVGITFGIFTTAVMAEPLPHRRDLTPPDRVRVAAVTDLTTDFSKVEAFEPLPAGAATSRKPISKRAFSNPSGNMSLEDRQNFAVGNGLFKKLWVSSPSSTLASDGLGPLFNARSCKRCHLHDGRGQPTQKDGSTSDSFFLRVSIPPQNEAQRAQLESGEILVVPEPTYGTQVQTSAVPGLPAEGSVIIRYRDKPIKLKDGTVVTLREPNYELVNLGYGDLHADALFSARVAPQMIGLGLLEAIHPGDIAALADPDDTDNDGISGKAHWIRDSTGKTVLGRFGFKATSPTVHVQSAEAFVGDIGISTPEIPRPRGDCTDNQQPCLAMPHGVQAQFGDAEAPPPVMSLVSFYARNLAVPKRRQPDSDTTLRGKQLFYSTGCVSCHTPKFVTRRDSTDETQSFQLVWPYTDMLLHDMGDGLADHRPVGLASGREWRTAPLWGVGLTRLVNGHNQLLHDGRARGVLEAILWHGGEAQSARDVVAAMPKSDRDAIIAFVESL